MFELTGIVKKFGDFTALEGVDLAIAPKQTTVILGPSGSGKSTLLRCMNLLEIPTAGKIAIDDDELIFPPTPSPEKQRRIRQYSAMVFQDFNLFPHLRALDNVTLGPRSAGVDPTEAEQRGRELLARVGLEQRVEHYPSQLSGGQQQRVAIARALAMQPTYLLCDEPTSALDPELEAEVIAVLADLARQHTSMVVVTHNMGFARRAADRIVFLDRGQIHFDGDPADFFAGPSERIQRFLDIYQAG